MAAIDKCYVNSWTEYQKFFDWAKDKSFTTPRGCKIVVFDYIMEWDEEDFQKDGVPCERPIFNSPTYLDNYLYHNCHLPFIQDWLKDRYSGEGYCKGDPSDIENDMKIPEYTPCKKVKILEKGLCKYSDKKLRMISVYSDNGEKYCSYNSRHDFWILPDEQDEWNSSVACLKSSIRAIINRIIKKWKLPVGALVVIDGRYCGDRWTLKTK